MKELATYLSVLDGPTAGFSLGKVKDNTGSAGTGSGAFAQFANGAYYGIQALALKYSGGVSDTDESETASDSVIAIERAIGIQNENVSEYVNTTTYIADDHALELGIQFVSMEAANVGNNPFSNPDKWLPCFSRTEAMVKWRNGEDIKCGFEAIHNHRDAAYRQYFQWGKYNFGGDAGSNYQATGLHLDGTVITGDDDLVALLDVGGAAEYHLLDIIAPDVTGTRTLLDTKGCTAAAVDATGGNRAIVGTAQDDAMQGHYHRYAARSLGNYNEGAVTSAIDDFSGAPTGTDDTRVTIPIADGTNGTPRTGLETQMKNYSTGIPAVMIMQVI